MHRFLSALRSHWHYIAIVLLTLAFYFPLILPGMGLPAGGDFYSYHTPFHIYMAMRLQAGEIPLRASELFGGYPIFQDPQFALLYPVNLLFALLMPPPETQALLDFYILINLLLLSLSAVYFARSFAISKFAATVAACIACFNGFMVIHVTHINMVQVLTTSFVAAGLLSRYHKGGDKNFRMALTAGLALAAGNLAGHPQTTMYTHYAIAAMAGAWALQRWIATHRFRAASPILIATATACALGIALAAIQLVPTASLLTGSTRAMVPRHSVIWSPLTVSQLPVVMFPGFYHRLPWELSWPLYTHTETAGLPGTWFYWMDPYMTECLVPIGAAAIALGLAGWAANWRRWQVQLLGWSSLFLLGCATGEDLPFYGWLYDFVPGVSLVRVSTRILIIFFPAWAMLAALGVDAIRQGGRRATIASRWAFTILLAIIMVWALWIFAGRKDTWIETWIRAFTGDENRFLALEQLRKRGADMMAALQKQLILAAFLLITLAAALLIPIRRPRRHLIALIGVMAIEIILYCFGWATAIHYPGISTTKAPELEIIAYPPTGRVVSHSGLNPALNMGVPLANGYTVTIDDWITAFQPDTMPPWRLGVQRRLLDLWNVSDVVIHRNTREAIIAGKPIAISDWGWTEIGAPWVPESGETSVTTRALMPSRFDMDFQTTRPVASVHLIAFSARADNEGDDREVARVTARTADGTPLTSAPVLLGRHVSDPRYPLTTATIADTGPRPSHSKAPLAYYRYIGDHWTSNVQFYDAALDLATTQPITSLTVQATGPYSTTLGMVSVVAILDDGSIVVHDPINAEGFSEIPSSHPMLRLLHRDNPPGYVHVIPTAVAGSYKKTDYIMWRMFNGETDPLKQIIVDKREYSEEDLRCLNAPVPDTFRSTATIQWPSPEKAIIHTQANQQGWLSLSYSYDPGWSARIDGKPVRILRGNGPFMAISIPGGTHTITMQYLPKGLIIGSLISLLAALILLILWLKSPRSTEQLRNTLHP